MKLISPIAGIGSRMRPFTLSKPKAFIRVAGKTVLDHILDNFKNTFEEGTELILIVGYKKRQIMEHIEHKYGDYFDLNFVEQIPRGYKDDTPYYWGLGEAIYLANESFQKEIKDSEEDKKNGSLIIFSDMILLDDYSYILYKYYEAYEAGLDGIITVMEVPKEEASSYGIAEVDKNNIIKQMIEKPKEYVSNLAIAGLYAFSYNAMRKLFSKLKQYLDQRTEDSKEIYMTESLQDLVNDGFKFSAVTLKMGILDFGRPSEVLNGNKYLLEHQNVNMEDFDNLNIVEDSSFIKHPVYIEKNTKIINSVIGPYVSIGKNSLIENCILHDCVIDKNTNLKNIITSKSIIGSNVKIENMSKECLIIGDKSIY